MLHDHIEFIQDFLLNIGSSILNVLLNISQYSKTIFKALFWRKLWDSSEEQFE